MPVSLTTADLFWSALAQSGLLTERQLSELGAVGSYAAETPAADVAAQLVARGLLTRFQADRLLSGQTRGFFFDRYKIVELLGLGGMGWVYEAVDLDSGEHVALKVLRNDLKHDAGMLARFHQEAAVGRRFDHPHIMRTRGMGEAGGLPYMIMDFIPGPNLLEVLLKNQRLPWNQACEIARQTALGLGGAHQQGIIHRDVKPQNLLLDRAGNVRLLDFGLSMLGDGESGDEFSLAMIFGHQGVGTFEYAAPEQATDSLAADAQSDLFSLGGTLFAAITGMNPVQPVAGKPGKHRREKDVSKYVAGVPQPVVQIVQKLLAENPAERFTSAVEVAKALEPWSKPLKIAFDYAELIQSRKREAELRQAQLSQTESQARRLSQSTARPTTSSSVAQARERPAWLSPAGESDLSATISLRSHATVDQLRGPVAAWGRNQSPLGLTAFAQLICEDGSVLPLKSQTLRLGRAADCDLQFVDTAVSQHHAELKTDGRQWWLRDLKSRNGTFVDGKAIRSRRLKSGDHIVIGEWKFRFEPAENAQSTKTANSGRWIVAAGIAMVIAAVIAWLAL